MQKLVPVLSSSRPLLTTLNCKAPSMVTTLTPFYSRRHDFPFQVPTTSLPHAAVNDDVREFAALNQSPTLETPSALTLSLYTFLCRLYFIQLPFLIAPTFLSRRKIRDSPRRRVFFLHSRCARKSSRLLVPKEIPTMLAKTSQSPTAPHSGQSNSHRYWSSLVICLISEIVTSNCTISVRNR